MTQDKAAEIALNNEMFLTHSITRHAQMTAADGSTFTEGKKLRFIVPTIPGWLKFIRVFFDLTVNVVVGTGTASVSAAAPWNVFQNLRVLMGGQELRNHHPYLLKLLKQSSEHDGGFWQYGGPVTQSYATTVFSTITSANGNNTWKGHIDIPMQMAPSSTLGLLPMGASSTPITLELDTCSSVDGTDPLLNPVRITGDSTASVTAGTISAVAYYAYGMSPHDPRIPVPTPVVGHFAKILQQETTIANTAGVTYADLREPYQHLKIFQVVVIPSQAAFCTFANIAGAKFDLDPGNPYLNYTSDGATIASMWADQRDRYGQDLDTGVLIWDFMSGSDPKHPDGVNSVNIEVYNAARAGVHYNGALAGSSNRILTAPMYLYKVSF